jgi:hypothetical protein
VVACSCSPSRKCSQLPPNAADFTDAPSSAAFGGLLIIAAYDSRSRSDAPLFKLHHRVFIISRELGAVNLGVLVGSLFGAGLLLIVGSLLALVRD